MKNTPRVRLAIVGVSRDCFPVELTKQRLAKLVESCNDAKIEPFCVPDVIIENEQNAVKALEICDKMDANAAVVYLGNFGPEGPISIFAKKFTQAHGPVMLCAAAEESGSNLINGRGDALCGLLSAKLNCDLREVKVHIPRKPVGLPDELAQEIVHFQNVARVMLGLRDLKIVTFGPRPQDFFACNAPIQPLLKMGIEVEENSELDLLQAFEAIADNDSEVAITAKAMAEELGEGNTYPDLLPRLARLEVCLKRWALAHMGAKKYIIFANKCWPGFEKAFGMVPCYVNGRLAAQGMPVACEVDIYGALSEYICQLAGNSVATLLDINNSVPVDLLQGGGIPSYFKPNDCFMGFHCGNTAAGCMKNCKICYQLIMHRLMEPGKDPEITRGTLEGPLQPGEVTMFRLQPKIGSGLMSYLAEGSVLDIDPKSFGGIGIIWVPGFGRFYRNVMLERGFPHHGAFTFVHTAEVIFDAMQLLGVNDIGYPLTESSLYKNENPFSHKPVERKPAKSIKDTHTSTGGRTVQVEELTIEAFAPFGTFKSLINPEGNTFGTPPIQFFPDLLTLTMVGKDVLGISICRVEPRPAIVDVTEFHSSTGEANLPLDADILIHVAEPTPNDITPWDKIRVFRVPMGTCVVMKPGVWHHAPFVVNAKVANVLVLLPERTYANDCEVAQLDSDQQTHII
jgi:L-fucose isomerase-like protein/ureidoglycolate hydrolase